MTRDELIENIAKVMAGLQVPMSMHMPLGAAIEPWSDLHTALIGFGWATKEMWEESLREILDDDVTDRERLLAESVLSMAASGSMPDTFWHTDSRIILACQVLDLTPEQAREWAEAS